MTATNTPYIVGLIESLLLDASLEVEQPPVSAEERGLGVTRKQCVGISTYNVGKYPDQVQPSADFNGAVVWLFDLTDGSKLVRIDAGVKPVHECVPERVYERYTYNQTGELIAACELTFLSKDGKLAAQHEVVLPVSAVTEERGQRRLRDVLRCVDAGID